MLNSAVIEEKKFKHSLRVRGTQPIRAKNFMSTGRSHNYGHFVASLIRISSTSDFITSFHDLINVYSHRSGADNPRGPGDKILMSTETSCHLDHLLQVLKKKTKKKLFV